VANLPRAYRTQSGSMVQLNGRGGTQVSLDWFEESSCCIECEPDLDASRASNWQTLIWTCAECGGGSAALTPLENKE